MSKRFINRAIVAASIIAVSGLGVNLKHVSVEMMPAVAQSCRNIEIRTSGNQNQTSGRGARWATCNGYRLEFQGDGNLVLYRPSGEPIWATGTEGSATNLAIQADGNVVIYNNSGQPIWATNTDGNPGAFLAIQTDGNVVVYRGNGQPIWATNTDGGRNSTRSAADEWRNASRPPQLTTPSNFRSVNFSGKAHQDGVNIRSAPSTSSSMVGRLQPNQQVNFDGWTYGDTVPDAWNNQPDARWYRIPGQGWVASAVVAGNAPDSTPLPGGNPPPTQTNSKAENFFSWANGQRGISRYDLNTAYNGQCVTLIARYVQDVFLPANERSISRAYGDGKDTASVLANNAPFNRYFGAFTRNGAPSRGAVISFAATSGNPYGHVAIVMETQGRRVRLLESNADNRAPNTTVINNRWINLDAGNVRGWTNPR